MKRNLQKIKTSHMYATIRGGLAWGAIAYRAAQPTLI